MNIKLKEEKKNSYIRIRVKQKWKDDLQEITGKKGMSKFVIDAVDEKMERENP